MGYFRVPDSAGLVSIFLPGGFSTKLHNDEFHALLCLTRYCLGGQVEEEEEDLCRECGTWESFGRGTEG